MGYYPKAEDHLPPYIADAYIAVFDRTEIEPQARLQDICDWVVYGDRNAEQYPEDTPEERLETFRWYRGVTEPHWYLNFYTEHQEYGGPEEGGWWYTVLTPSDLMPSVPLRRGREAWDRGKELLATFVEMAEDGKLDDICYIKIERHAARITPKHRPHYY